MSISRRAALRILAQSTLLPLAMLWRAMARQQGRRPRRSRQLSLVLPLPPGLSVHGEVAVWYRADRYTTLGTRCTHLGCRLRPGEGETLICPCHGSRFAANGGPMRGPAREPLTVLPCRVDPEQGRLIVELPH
ncbi:MAG: Rieske (2Fe-2S) protein [bacterium]|nr:Rieske (2Fe-2S) protein [bacterium]